MPSLGAGTFDTHSSYNLDKQLLEINRPDSLDIQYIYAASGRLDTVIAPHGSYAFTYFPETGNLDSLVSPYGVTTHFTYDGSLPKSVTWSGEITGNISVEYDANFWVTAQILNGTDSVSMSYDYDGKLVSAGEMALTWDENGRLFGTDIGNFADLYTYNQFGEMAKYQVLVEDDSIYQCYFQRDKLGRITQKTETILGLTHTYQYAYDMAGRLDSVLIDSAALTSYAYDSNSNRLTRTIGATVDSGTYDNQDRMMTYGGVAYSYNRNGDLERKIAGSDTTRYEYDVFGNLETVKMPNGDSITYILDGTNRRVGKRRNGAFVQGFLFHSKLNPIAEVDSAGNVLACFVYGSKGNVPDQMIWNDTTYKIISDQLGSPRLVVNTSTGTVAQRMDYDEFGNVTYDSNPGFQPFGFAGGLYDWDTKLVRFGARDYSSQSGRWTTKDPIGFAGGLNHYVYVENNPVNNIDPNGTDVLVIYNGPTSGNPFGHTAIAVTGSGVYSFGNNTDLGSSLTDYLKDQVGKRDNVLTLISTSPQQDDAVLKYLGQFTDRNGVNRFPDNCANRVNDALSAGGIHLKDPYTGFPPLNFPASIERSAVGSGNPSVLIPKGGLFPPGLSIFNP